MAHLPGTWTRHGWLLGLGVILVVLGAKLGLIDRYGTDQPYADQWAVEGVGFVRAPMYFDAGWGSYFSLHGEHRPALTRFWVKNLIWLNDGQWDCQVELVANLAIFGALFAGLWTLARRVTGGAGQLVAAVGMAALFALPGAYENVLWGFQSCFLFLLLCGLVHVGGTLCTDRPGWAWVGAQVAGLAGLFSISAGVMSAATLVALAAWESWRGRRDAWVLATLAVNAVLLAAGLWMLPDGAVAPAHRGMSLLEAIHRTGYLLAWPGGDGWWGWLLQAPWAGLAIGWIVGRARDECDRIVVVTGVWIVLLAFAIAYGRAITPATIGVRYHDVMLVGLFVNLLALIRLIARPSAWARWAWSALALAWLAAVGSGLWEYNKPGMLRPLLEFQRSLALEQARVVRAFMVSNNVAELTEYAGRSGRFPHLKITIELLQDERVYPYLPPSLARGGASGRLSQVIPGLTAGWSFLVGAGVVLLLAGIAGRWLVRPAPT